MCTRSNPTCEHTRHVKGLHKDKDKDKVLCVHTRYAKPVDRLVYFSLLLFVDPKQLKL